MALEDFASGRYPAMTEAEREVSRSLAMDRYLGEYRIVVDPAVEAAAQSEWEAAVAEYHRTQRSIVFTIAELPPTYRMATVPRYRSDEGDGVKECRYDPQVDRAVAFAAKCGVVLPLDPDTPPGVVGDYIQEHCPDTADSRALIRMFWKIQSVLEERAS